MKNWPLVALGDIFDIARGGSPRPIQQYLTDDPDGINWIMIGDASGSSKYIENVKKRIRKDGASKSRMVYPGDFLLTNSMSFGHPYILKTSGCIHDGWLVLSNPDNSVDQDYLYHLLGSDIVFREFQRRAAGAVVKNLNIDLVKGVEIPLPPLAEQKRIAAILDKADAVSRKRQAANKLADDFIRATFLDMFGDPVTNPKGWNVKPIGELLADKPNAARTGPFGSQLKHSEFTTKGIPVLGIDNIVTNNFRWTTPRCLPPEKYEGFKRYQVFPDDIIITIMGTTGRVAVAPADLPECMSTKHLCVLTLNKNEIDPVFLWAVLLFDTKARSQAKRSSGGAIMEGWNMGIIKEIDVRIPPIKNQRQFRLIIEKMKHLKDNKLFFWEGQSDNLFNSLTQRAFRGDL